MSALTELEYPALCFGAKGLFPVRNYLDLTTGTKHALKRSFYNNLEIIGSDNILVCVKQAEKISGVGPMWGYNIFLNQRIRLRFILEGGKTSVSFDEVKRRVILAINGPGGWNSLVGFDQLENEVKGASNTSEIVEILLKYWSPTPAQ